MKRLVHLRTIRTIRAITNITATLAIGIATFGGAAFAQPTQSAPVAQTKPMLPTMEAPGAITAQLSGASEVPPNDSEGTGALEASYDDRTRVLRWKITYSALTGAVTAAHFHGPALPGENASPVVPITGKLASPITGKATLTTEQVAALMNGKWYVNLHTAAHPGGEIRGQVNMTP
jgi:CHRD domain